ncbi:MAG: DUF2889 domain-containing protein [Actinomycetota bacterium]|nr:DUF2889 domain-containing protein [Actinomycetota bacterium]
MTEGFRSDPILPPPPDGAVPVLHNREYRVQTYRMGTDRLLIQAALRDQRPPGLSIPDDPEPMTVHHMTLELLVSYPEAEVLEATTAMVTHPRSTCTEIVERYDELVGLSLTRGFTHKVRELLGGPRGCSHTTALLQAMAPAAMQSFVGMRTLDALERGEDHPLHARDPLDGSWERLLNTCHVWAEDGPAIATRRAGNPDEQLIPIRRRLAQLGRDE